jgi:hypothetical protein
MLTFEVASFNISYNCILRRPFLLKFMVVIHTAYNSMKMTGPKGVITIKASQRDALACENATLTHAGRFGEKAAQEKSANVARTQGGITLLRSSAPKPPTVHTPRTIATKKGAYTTSTSTQLATDQTVDDKKKGTNNKEILADPSNLDKKLWIHTSLDPK